MASTERMTSDPIDILLEHNRWANGEILRRCGGLTDEQFHRRFNIGLGDLHDTMSHVIGAMLRWSDRIDGRPLRPSIGMRPAGPDAPPMERRTAVELLRVNDEACADFAAVVGRQRARLAEVRDWTFGDKGYRFTVCAAILHVTNHGMHHRAQCMNMLKQLGLPVNADLDELEWQVAGEP